MQVATWEAQNRNRVGAYEACFARHMATAAEQRYPDATVAVVDVQEPFCDENGEHVCELDAAVLIHHAGGPVECWLGEHKSTLNSEALALLTFKREKIRCALRAWLLRAHFSPATA